MKYSPKNLNLLPQTSGVYIYRNKDKKIIYIGKAVNLKNRIRSYFQKTNLGEKSAKIAAHTATIEIIQVESEFEAHLLEAKLIKENLPKFNVIWRDDKSYIYIEITKEQFPRILLSRKKGALGNLFGPYPSATLCREIIRFLRHIFPFCTQKLPAKKECFYNHLGLCKPCPALILKTAPNRQKELRSEYLKNIKSIRSILSGNYKKIVATLTREMKFKAENNEFEDAADMRDKIEKLELLLSRKSFKLEQYIENPDLLAQRQEKETEELTKILSQYFKFDKKINYIECYDISNTSGKLATGSLVSFKDGKPDKTRYRHFRIRTIDTPNDFQMLQEVFQRRLKHKEWPLPDVIMVDGGAQQLEILNLALLANGINLPAISLAKRLEEIYIKKDKGFIRIDLPNSNPALNLLKRLRDESHRFANTYHRKLRIKNLLGLLRN